MGIFWLLTADAKVSGMTINTFHLGCSGIPGYDDFGNSSLGDLASRYPGSIPRQISNFCKKAQIGGLHLVDPPRPLGRPKP